MSKTTQKKRFGKIKKSIKSKRTKKTKPVKKTKLSKKYKRTKRSKKTKKYPNKITYGKGKNDTGDMDVLMDIDDTNTDIDEEENYVNNEYDNTKMDIDDGSYNNVEIDVENENNAQIHDKNLLILLTKENRYYRKDYGETLTLPIFGLMNNHTDDLLEEIENVIFKMQNNNDPFLKRLCRVFIRRDNGILSFNFINVDLPMFNVEKNGFQHLELNLDNDNQIYDMETKLLYNSISLYLSKTILNFDLIDDNITLYATFDYFYKRQLPPTGNFGFHKDSYGYTDFVTLSYLTKKNILGPEIVICPNYKTVHNLESVYRYVNLESAENIMKNECQTFFRPLINPGFTIGFSDVYFAHSSPSFLFSVKPEIDPNQQFIVGVHEEDLYEGQQKNIIGKLPSNKEQRAIGTRSLIKKGIDINADRVFARTWWQFKTNLTEDDINLMNNYTVYKTTVNTNLILNTTSNLIEVNSFNDLKQQLKTITEGKNPIIDVA